METKYFFVEIEFMKDGSIPKAITKKDTMDDAYAQYHQTMASCHANKDCLGYMVYVIDSDGMIVTSENYRKQDYKSIKERLIDIIRERLENGEEIETILGTLVL